MTSLKSAVMHSRQDLSIHLSENVSQIVKFRNWYGMSNKI